MWAAAHVREDARIAVRCAQARLMRRRGAAAGAFHDRSRRRCRCSEHAFPLPPGASGEHGMTVMHQHGHLIVL
jgi:hypothetical protein